MEETGDGQSKGKSKKKKIWMISVLAGLLLVFCSAGILFWNELQIISSIKKVSAGQPVYSLAVNGDYHFEDFLQSGGAASDAEVSAFLTKKISKGFYAVGMKHTGLACSTISAKGFEGAHVWGRNFDWYGSVPIIVKCTPKNGYASISTCDFQNITGNPDTVPDGLPEKMLSIAALYVPLDGVNEAGLCVADLEVNEGGMVTVDTDKPNLTVTTAIRLLLNEAATVDEAIDLLKQYDIYASGGISHHIAISDGTGHSVVVEFAENELVVLPTNVVTNFNLAHGDMAAGGESAKNRYETLNSLYEKNQGVFSMEQVRDALAQTVQASQAFTTQWSIVYDQNAQAVDYYFYGDYTKPYRYSVGK